MWRYDGGGDDDDGGGDDDDDTMRTQTFGDCQVVVHRAQHDDDLSLS